jgi:hypothetical protein
MHTRGVLVTYATQQKNGVRDFDFWIGEWKVRNRRLVERLAGSDEWIEFDAEVTARFLMDGAANEDEFRTDFDGGETWETNWIMDFERAG